MMDVYPSLSTNQLPGIGKAPMSAGANLIDSTDHATGFKDFAEHDLKTKNEIRLKQPYIKDYVLLIRQEPEIVEASEYEPHSAGKKPSTRKKSAHAIEPMPVVELVVGQDKQTNPSSNINPLLFLYARLLPESSGVNETDIQNQLIGGHAASLFRYKKEKLPQENGYFIFQDLRVKFPGRFRIGFTLCEVVEDYQGLQYVLPCTHIVSRPFEVLKKGSPLPEPRLPSELIKSIEGAGAKLRYRKAQQNKKVKLEQTWASSLDDMNAGRVRPTAKRTTGGKRRSLTESDGTLIIESTPVLPTPSNPNYSGMQAVSQAGLYPSLGLYNGIATTSPSIYTTVEGNGVGPANFQVPQAQFTFSHQQMPQMATSLPMFDSGAYDMRARYQSHQFGEGLQTPQHPMTGAPMMHGVQAFQSNTQYLESHMPDQQRMMVGAQYHGAQQYPNPNAGMPQYDEAGNPVHPMHFDNSGYGHQYPPQSEDPNHSRGFYQG